MRAIKFRAWNIDDKIMCYDNEDNSSSYWDGVDSSIISLVNSQFGYSLYHFMQFTGLKDSKGVEIYEGDILREPAANQWEEVNFVVYEVFWHDNDCADGHIGWQMNRTHYHGSLCGGSIWCKMLPKYTKKMLVMGNIHQNPELLK